MASYYEYFKKVKIDPKKVAENFFRKYKKDILKNWLENYAFCKTVDYNTASCDEYIVAAEMAREIVQPLYDLVEKIENEISSKLFMLFLAYSPKCSSCVFFVTGKEAERLAGRPLAHNEGYCLKHKRVVSNDNICKDYEAGIK